MCTVPPERMYCMLSGFESEVVSNVCDLDIQPYESAVESEGIRTVLGRVAWWVDKSLDSIWWRC